MYANLLTKGIISCILCLDTEQMFIKVIDLDKIILHCDLNNFYASVECVYNPALAGRPLAVCGKAEERHGIVLAKNNLAKAKGVKTGHTIWQAKKLCPDMITVPPDFKKYIDFSHHVREIFLDYTDLVEPFGIDEAWLDITGNTGFSGNGAAAADSIRNHIKRELGITASVGVSWNKVFAKLGSDLKKPDITTEITKENYRQVVWPLPVGDLLYVGRATSAKLGRYMINTIGSLANTDPVFLRRLLGKPGEMLWRFANGLDNSPVSSWNRKRDVKSIGNSTTTPRDIVTEEDAKAVLYVLADSVAARLREHGLRGNTVQLWIRSADLMGLVRQVTLPRPTWLTSEICLASLELLHQNWRGEMGIRSLGISVSGFNNNTQLCLYDNDRQISRQETLEHTTDDLRRRFGYGSLQRACLLASPALTGFNPKDDHTIHPVSYFS